jgi:hypothetical protein
MIKLPAEKKTIVMRSFEGVETIAVYEKGATVGRTPTDEEERKAWEVINADRANRAKQRKVTPW